MHVHKNMSTGTHTQSVITPSTDMRLEKGRKAPSSFYICLKSLACHALLYSQKKKKKNAIYQNPHKDIRYLNVILIKWSVTTPYFTTVRNASE